jgi:hypothetical protein
MIVLAVQRGRFTLKCTVCRKVLQLQIARKLCPTHAPKSTPYSPASMRDILRALDINPSSRSDARALAGLLARSKAPDLDRRLARTPTQDRANLASENNLPYSFARRSDITEVYT